MAAPIIAQPGPRPGSWVAIGAQAVSRDSLSNMFASDLQLQKQETIDLFANTVAADIETIPGPKMVASVMGKKLPSPLVKAYSESLARVVRCTVP